MQRGRDFPQPPSSAMGPTQPPVKMGTGYFLGVELPCRGVPLSFLNGVLRGYMYLLIQILFYHYKPHL